MSKLPTLSTALILTTLLIAVAQAFHPGDDLLLYSRAELVNGEVWRLFSAHLVHFGWRHLLTDLAAFAVLAIKIEKRSGGWSLALLLLGMAVVTSTALWLWAPQLQYYGGLSAINYGLLAWLTLSYPAKPQAVNTHYLWLAKAVIITALGLHIYWQAATTAMLPSTDNIVIAWQAHLASLITALTVWSLQKLISAFQPRLYVVARQRMPWLPKAVQPTPR